jgi:hypothetical protein
MDRAKGELKAQHHPAFGAPHFPPSENLPPQAKRLAKKKAQARHPKPAAPEPLRAEDFPTGQPAERPVEAAREELGEAWTEVRRGAEPVLQEARTHWGRLRGALQEVWGELRAVMRIPGALVQALRSPRRTA